jgi:hypothetical protein
MTRTALATGKHAAAQVHVYGAVTCSPKLYTTHISRPAGIETARGPLLNHITANSFLHSQFLFPRSALTPAKQENIQSQTP